MAESTKYRIFFGNKVTAVDLAPPYNQLPGFTADNTTIKADSTIRRSDET